MSNKISVILACDNHYVTLLSALLKSVEMNHHTDELIDVYIVDDQISKTNKQKLTKSLTLDKMKLIWLKMDEIIPEGVTLPLVANSTYPLNIYIRILIPYFIPKEVSKIIYMDVDMIMLDDISNLWKIETEGKVVAAVNDTFGDQVKTIAEGIENYKELGLDPEEKFFNSGMLVINIDKWREQDITQKTFDAINNNKKYVFGDQYGLNIALIGNWKEIDRMWNCFSICTDPHPKLIHYFHRKPIYKTYANNYKDEFFYYLHRTEWKNFQPIGETTRYLKKINNILEKIKMFFK